jgi:glycosyltransferase involved in cell wall biosynthesis
MVGRVMIDHKLSLIIPVYNEAATLPAMLKKLGAVDFRVPVEFVLIDDDSADHSFQIIKDFAKQHPNSVVHKQPKNQGKGAAIRTGLRLASGTLVMIQDADLEYDPRDIPELIEPILEDTADVVYGSRFKASGNQVHRTWHRLVNLMLTSISNLCSGLYFSDMETCYKMFRAEILKNLVLDSDRFGFEPEVTAKIAKLRVRASEIPIRYYPRSYDEGKKIGWKDGVAALWYIAKYNFLCPARQCSLPALPAKYLPRP